MRRWSRLLTHMLDRYHPSETTILLLLAILIGLVTGFAAVIFIDLIDWITRFSFGNVADAVPSLGRWWLILIPVIGSLISGPIIAFFASEAKGHGVPEVMQALVLNGGRIRPRVAVAKIAASSVCIGTGGSAGREGPIVQVGSTFGSTMGQLFRMSDRRISNLVACGAAAGIAATFNAPIAGVAFAIEVLAGDLAISVVSNVVIASVTAAVVSQAFLGSEPAFHVPAYTFKSPVEILFYVVLGVLSGVMGVVFIKALYGLEDVFDNWKKMPMWARPAIGALLLGLTGFVYPPLLVKLGLSPILAKAGLPVIRNIPHIFGAGFDTIEAALIGPLPWIFLISLLFLKLLATALTLGSGNSGGVFAPALFMGAMLGGLFGLAVDMTFPALGINPATYALAGMAAVFVGAARAPLTAILIAFEMSNDYKVILPLMAATIVALVIAHRMHPESIYTLKLARRGLRLRLGRDVDVLDGVLVSEVMTQNPPAMNESNTMEELETYLLNTRHHGVVVTNDEDELVGVVTLQDLDRCLHNRKDCRSLKIRDAMSKTLLTAYPDESIGDALHRMAARDVGRMPVVDRNNPKKLLGAIRRNDIARAYQKGVLRRDELSTRANQLRASRSSGTEFIELRVEPGSMAAGKKVKELSLPEDVLLTTRFHDAQHHLLHGDDVLSPGDIVLALAEPDAVKNVETLFKKKELSVKPESGPFE
ncbi:MAG: chloride channel protein [Clostridia bacterium]|nr:MAG: chloride channel protein [Clostridia bacterium]